MSIKIVSLVNDIKNEFQKAYAKFGNIEERNDYKFIMMICEKFPDFEMSVGFPKYLLADEWEVIYDIFGNYDVKTAIEDRDKTFHKFIDFVEDCAKKPDFKRSVECVFDGIYGIVGVSDLYKVFHETTTKLWKEYTKDWKNLKL